MNKIAENLYWLADRANDVAEFYPPVMHPGSDGARMEVYTLRLSDTDAVQVVFNLGQTTTRQRDALLRVLRSID